MACKEKVSFWVARGYSHREVEVLCGRTDPYGGRATCESCDRKYGAQIAQDERAIAEDNAAAASAGWGEY
jgi:hypothetical protein